MATSRVTTGQREEMMSDSSSPVSTPPGAPQSPETGHLSPTPFSNVAKINVFHVGGSGGGVATNGIATTSANNNHPDTVNNVVIKRPRKKINVDGAQDAEAKQRKAPKPRAPKDPNAPPKPRKKPKISHEAINDSLQERSRQRLEDLQKSLLANACASPPTPRPASSGQRYDPVRSATIEPYVSNNPFNAPAASSLKLVSRPSASSSPTIASILDPPPAIIKSTDNTSSSLHHVAQNQLNPGAAPTTASQSATRSMQSPFAVRTSSSAEIKSSTTSSSHTSDMEIDKPTVAELNACTLPTKKTSSNGASPAPKQPRQKEPPPPLPLGSGLLSNDLFGGPPSFSSSATGTETPTIVITVPLLGETNKYINFAQEAEKKYGFNALYPRLAAHRERQARIAAASDALEKGSSANGGTNTNSGDEMSLDNSEAESDREGGGGAGDGGSGPDGIRGGEVVKKRKKRTEGYDKEDDFIDDTELIWEEQAAASKDGFFVYSGPLVREGGKPAVERADGTVRRGRGRGRGSTRGEGASTRGSRGDGTSTRGSRGGGAGTSTRGARGEGTSTRGTRGGRGPRGGATLGTTRGSPAAAKGVAAAGSKGGGLVRKPRVSSTGDADIEAAVERARQKAEVDAVLERVVQKTKWERDGGRVGMDQGLSMTEERKGGVVDVVMSDRGFGGGVG